MTTLAATFAPITDRLPDSVNNFGKSIAEYAGRGFKYFSEEALKYPIAAYIGVNVAVFYIADLISKIANPILACCCIPEWVTKYSLIGLANFGLYTLLQPTLLVALAVPTITILALEGIRTACKC